MGKEIYFGAGSLRLPAEKLHRLVAAIQDWGDRKVCTHKEFESLIGQLNHACKVVLPGADFPTPHDQSADCHKTRYLPLPSPSYQAEPGIPGGFGLMAPVPSPMEWCQHHGSQQFLPQD